MSERFGGSLDDLKGCLSEAYLDGTWVSDANGKHTFRGQNGGVLTWWAKTGTIQIQGKDDAKSALQQAVATSSGDFAAAAAGTTRPGRGGQIFIVHGHDNEARD